MKKEYVKPDVEYIEFITSKDIVYTPDISVEIGDDDQEGI